MPIYFCLPLKYILSIFIFSSSKKKIIDSMNEIDAMIKCRSYIWTFNYRFNRSPTIECRIRIKINSLNKQAMSRKLEISISLKITKLLQLVPDIWHFFTITSNTRFSFADKNMLIEIKRTQKSNCFDIVCSIHCLDTSILNLADPNCLDEICITLRTYMGVNVWAFFIWIARYSKYIRVRISFWFSLTSPAFTSAF